MILLVTIAKGGRLAKSALELLSAARELGDSDTPITGLVIGEDSAVAADELARFLPTVSAISAPQFAAPSAELLSAAVVHEARERRAGVVIASAGRSGLSFTPRVAVELQGALLEDVIAVEPSDDAVEAKRWICFRR